MSLFPVIKRNKYERNMLSTPEGVRDIYGVECERKHIL